MTTLQWDRIETLTGVGFQAVDWDHGVNVTIVRNPVNRCWDITLRDDLGPTLAIDHGYDVVMAKVLAERLMLQGGYR